MSKFAKKPALNTEGETKVAKLTAVKGAKVAAKAEKPAKAPKAEKAAKAPKAKAEPKERVKKDDNRKITNVVKENPHREGTGRYEAYEAVKKAKKVSDYLEAGHKPKYLAKWDEQGLITLSE